MTEELEAAEYDLLIDAVDKWLAFDAVWDGLADTIRLLMGLVASHTLEEFHRQLEDTRRRLDSGQLGKKVEHNVKNESGTLVKAKLIKLRRTVDTRP